MKSGQQQSCTTHRDLQLWSWSFLHPNLFEKFKALEFELKMDLQIKKKKETTSLGPILSGPAYLPPPVA